MGWEGLRANAGTGVLLLAAAAASFGWWRNRPLDQPPGILAPGEPSQGPPETTVPWVFRGHTLVPLARFEIRARILGAERYRFDRAAELSPVDLALGWGPMSDTKVLEALSIRQSGRWYFWRADRLPIPAPEITRHSANMHMIPANEAVARRLTGARPGQLVHLEGDLVRVDGKDGWHWVSSLSRADSGDGSCEVVWVTWADVSDR